MGNVLLLRQVLSVQDQCCCVLSQSTLPAGTGGGENTVKSSQSTSLS